MTRVWLCWESVTNPLDKLSRIVTPTRQAVGNQLPILLISFRGGKVARRLRWESVTNPLDKLYHATNAQVR